MKVLFLNIHILLFIYLFFSWIWKHYENIPFDRFPKLWERYFWKFSERSETSSDI